MGDLLLCNHQIAAMPYYIEMVSLNIYSLEELCYVIEHYTFVLDEGFFDDELILWIEKEIGENELAGQLRQSLRKEQGVTKLVELVLNATGYLSYESGIKVLSRIREMQHKTVFERRKMRADRYIGNKKYVNALLEYRRILQMEEECKKNPVMCGNIWHNLGVVYARLFLFREARECFQKAYHYHMNMESVFAAMAASLYLGEETEAGKLAEKYGLEEQKAVQLRERLESISQSNEFVNEEDGMVLMQRLYDWKAEYQKNCR